MTYTVEMFLTSSNQSESSSGLSLAIRLQSEISGAWAELVDLYAPLVESWAASAGLPPAIRQDITQEVFLAVHRSIKEFDTKQENATFRGWLWRITRNAVLQHHRRNPLQPRGGSTAAEQLAEVADPWEGGNLQDPPSSATDTTELVARALKQIESRVDPITWQAFIRTTMNGEKAIDVAEDLNLTPAAVRKAKSRTLQRLRKQLGDLH